MESCHDCGKPIEPGQTSYVANPGPGAIHHYHSKCGDPLGIKAAVAAERERCALIADNAAFAMSPGPLYSAGFVDAKKFIAGRIRSGDHG